MRVAPGWWLALVTLCAAGVFAGFAALQQARGTLFRSDDPVGYYVYLRSLVHDGDLDFTNDYAFFRQPDGSPPANFDRRDPVTGRPDNIYTVGVPLLAAPVYLAGNLVFRSYYPGDGAATFPLFLDQLLFSYGSLLWGFCGLWLTFKFVCSYFPPRESLAATLAFWGCSPLLYYFAREPFESHLAAVFAASLLLSLWRLPSLPAAWRALLMGMAAGLLCIVRQQDIVVLLVPVGAALLARQVRGVAWRTVLLFGIGFGAVFSIQMVVWHSLRGAFLTFSYRGAGFPNLAHPKLFEVLFSSNHGLLSWHPLIALCLVGLVILPRSAGALGPLALACVGLELYVIGSWWSWWMGYSFGNRGFLGLTPLFVLGLAAVFVRIQRPWLRRVMALAVLLLFLWNVTLMLAYLAEMIPYEGTFSWWALLHALPQLPAQMLAKIHRL